ncbi:serine/threonine-protein kinase [Nocardioides nanhaiensis]|uniref:non-specific serine/threonine protein kinase n=1 Tax=Nocardioides nanhaiensis TaxID=1476871 RepID=A0ABP8VY58_9ACTN
MARFPVPGEEFGDYQVVRQLGRGGMGVVFAATDRALGRTVALKVLPPELAGQPDYRERFGREAGILASLDSPHIITIFAHGEHDGCLFIATQYVAGGDLADAIKAHGPVPLRVAARIGAQLASALGDAHRAGVVHRDIKPHNVLLRQVSDDPFAYLCDFGIAQNAEPGLTQAGQVAGTFAYLAPERCEGQPATPAADVYALGCVLWTAIAGRAPYGGTDIQVGNAHLSAPVPQVVPDSAAATALNQVLQRSMAKNPADRFPDAHAMRTALTRVAELAGQPGTPAVRPVPSSDAPRAPFGALSQPSRPSQPSTAGYQPSQPSFPSSAGAPVLPPTPYRPGPPPPPPRRSRTGLLVAGAVAAVVLVAGGITALALSGDDDERDRADDPETSDTSDPTDEPTEDPTAEEPTSPPAPTPPPSPTAPSTPAEPRTREPRPTYPDVPAASGIELSVGAATVRAPSGWGQITQTDLGPQTVGARNYSDFEGYASSVYLRRTKPPIPLSGATELLESVAESSIEQSSEGDSQVTLLGTTTMPRAWLDGEQAVRVRANYRNNTDGLDLVQESWFVARGPYLWRITFENSLVDTRAERRAIIDPMVVAWRWR